MKTFKSDLLKRTEDIEFKGGFSKYWHLANLAVQIEQSMKSQGLSQEDLAKRSHITLQQVSKMLGAGDAGYTVKTLFKICDALGLDIDLKVREKK